MSSREQTGTRGAGTGRGQAIYDFATREPLWTVTRVAALLRVSRMTIYRMVHSGELGHVRLGRAFRIPDTEVRRLLTRPHTTQHP